MTYELMTDEQLAEAYLDGSGAASTPARAHVMGLREVSERAIAKYALSLDRRAERLDGPCALTMDDGSVMLFLNERVRAAFVDRLRRDAAAGATLPEKLEQLDRVTAAVERFTGEVLS